MFWKDLLGWAIHAAASSAQKAAVAEVQKAAQQLSTVIDKNAPDASDAAHAALSQATSAIVAGLMTRKF